MKENYHKLKFQKFLSVNNPLSIHGIYPYRGKISALDAQSIISQLPQKGTLLDPFCGSGTIIYEAQKHGLSTIGIDNNPLAIHLAKAKTSKKKIDILDECAKIIVSAQSDLKTKSFSIMPDIPLKSFHTDTANEIMTIKKYFDDMDDYLKGIFFGTIALAARGCNNYQWTSSTVGKNIEPKVYINFYDKFMTKARKHATFLLDSTTPNTKIISADSRELSKYIPAKTIDFVLTSPPYFDGLDYTAYYGKLIYDIFEVDRLPIKKNLIQHVNTYEEDMAKVLKELDIVTSDNATIIFVVGDKKIRDKIINGGEFFNKIMPASYIIERNYSGSSSQIFDILNNTKRREQIIVWEKQKGRVIVND